MTQFNEQTFEALRGAIEKTTSEITGKGVFKGYVVDLRNNPGGLLDQAISVSDAFLDRGEIVSTRGRNQERQRFNAKPGDLTKGKPVVVLINGGSASPRRSSPGPCRTSKRATVLGTAPSARARCRRSSRSAATARCA